MDKIAELAILISQQGGEIEALNAVLRAVCLSTVPGSPLATAIEWHLESGISGHLQKSQNEHFVDGYRCMSEILMKSLRAKPIGYNEQSPLS